MLLFRQTLKTGFWARSRSWRAHIRDATSHSSALLGRRQRVGWLAPWRWQQVVPRRQVCRQPAGKSLRHHTGTGGTGRAPGRQSHPFARRRHLSASRFSFTKGTRNRGAGGRLRGMGRKRFLKNSPFRVCFNFLIYGFEVAITWGRTHWQKTHSQIQWHTALAII